MSVFVPRIDLLSMREREVLTLLAVGAEVKDIARELRIRPGTVKNHMNAISQRLGTRNARESVAAWRGETPYSQRGRTEAP